MSHLQKDEVIVSDFQGVEHRKILWSVVGEIAYVTSKRVAEDLEKGQNGGVLPVGVPISTIRPADRGK